MFLKKLTIMVLPLLICVTQCILFPLIKKWGFLGGVSEGILIGIGLGAILPLVYKPAKKSSMISLLWLPLALLLVLLLYQYLTFENMLHIPALSFLNVEKASFSVLLESAMAAFLGTLMFVTRK